MSEIFSSQLIIGLTGALFCGIFSFFLTRLYLGRKERHNYQNKIDVANNEILNLVRPFIIDHKIPTRDILSAIVISTAKKYDVKHQYLYNIDALSNDLINEILSNPFLSPTQKLEYCTLLTLFQEFDDKEKDIVYLGHNRSSTIISYHIGLIIFSLILLGVLSLSDAVNNSLLFTIPLIVIFGISALILIISAIPSWNKSGKQMSENE